MASIKGSNKGETLRGTDFADKIQALGGNDIVFGYGGNDTIEAGGGDDTVDGGAGSDTIDGGLGLDTLDYSSAAGPINVRYAGYATDTNGVGNVEELNLSGGLLSTDKFSSIENLIATRWNDLIYGGGGANSIRGGAGDDRINGYNGNDTMYGGAGDDLIDIGNGNDYADGGDGIDTLFWDFGALLHAVVDLQAGTVTYSPAYGPDNWDIVLNFENVRGREGDKQIFGSDAANIVQGSRGADLIDGRGGDDILVGDFGRFVDWASSSASYNDTIRGGDGNDIISGDLGTDVLTGGDGSDRFVVDSYFGTDTITDFEDGFDTLALYGGLTITGWEARDTNGDGADDAQAALLSNGEAVIFAGYAAPPSLGGTGIEHYAEQFAIPELTTWSTTGGWGGDGF